MELVSRGNMFCKTFWNLHTGGHSLFYN